VRREEMPRDRAGSHAEAEEEGEKELEAGKEAVCLRPPGLALRRTTPARTALGVVRISRN